MQSKKPAKKPIPKGPSAARRTARPPADTRRTAPPPPADSKPVARAGASDGPAARPRTEGQRLLAGVLASLGDIARKVGCSSRQTVSDWRSGAKVPGAAFRQRLQEEYGIPAEAWDHQPANGRPVPTAPPSSSPAASAPKTTLDQCLALIHDTERDLTEEQCEECGRGGKLVPAERVKLRDTLARALSLRHRLESAGELIEDRIVLQHPTWKRMKAVMLRVLTRHPEALREMLEAWKEFGE